MLEICTVTETGAQEGLYYRFSFRVCSFSGSDDLEENSSKLIPPPPLFLFFSSSSPSSICLQQAALGVAPLVCIRRSLLAPIAGIILLATVVCRRCTVARCVCVVNHDRKLLRSSYTHRARPLPHIPPTIRTEAKTTTTTAPPPATTPPTATGISRRKNGTDDDDEGVRVGSALGVVKDLGCQSRL